MLFGLVVKWAIVVAGCIESSRLTGQGVVGMDNVGALGLLAELNLGTAVA